MTNAAWASSHTTDLPSRRSVTPISRGRRERPRVTTRGRFVFAVRKGITGGLSRLHRAPRSIRTCWSEAGMTAKAHRCAVPGCFGTGGRRMHSHTDWRLRRDANAEQRSNGPQRHGFKRPSGARGAAVAHAGDRGTVFRERTKAQGQSSGASRWPPVRIRFVHHWIAQSGRAPNFQFGCRGFESRSKQRPVTSLPGRKPDQETPRAGFARRCAMCTTRNGTRSGGVAGPAPSRRAGDRGSAMAAATRRGCAEALIASRTARRFRGIGARGVSTFFSFLARIARSTRSRQPIHRALHQADRTTRANKEHFRCSGPRGS